MTTQVEQDDSKEEWRDFAKTIGIMSPFPVLTQPILYPLYPRHLSHRARNSQMVHF